MTRKWTSGPSWLGRKHRRSRSARPVVGRFVFASGRIWTARSVGSTATNKGRDGKIALGGTSLRDRVQRREAVRDLTTMVTMVYYGKYHI